MDNNAADLEILFRRAARAMLRGHRHHGPLHPAQGRILSLINAHGSIHRKELLELIELRSGSLSELLGKLEKHGYITKTQNQEDKRGFMLTITEKGAALVAAHHMWKTNNIEDQFAVLSPEERQQLADILLKLTTAWEEHGPAGDERYGHHDLRAWHEHGRRRPHCHGRHGEGGNHRRGGDHERLRHGSDEE